MKTKHLLALAVLIQAGCMMIQSQEKAPCDVRIMTFNIRYDTARDGENRWDKRKALACQVIRDCSPDILGIQEANRHQLDVFTEDLPEYTEVGLGRDGGRKGEYSAILFRKDRFDLAASGTFWLSETPNKPSQDWGSACRRICTWVQLTDKASKRSFFVYNTHLDHKSQEARMKGIQLIKDKMDRQRAGQPAVLMGDFNAEEDNPVITFLKGAETAETSRTTLTDTFRACHPDETIVGTYHAFTGDTNMKRIDYIFTTSETRVLDATIVRTSRNGRYPSDHFPVTAHLRFD